MKKNNFKSVIKETFDKELNTFPSKYPNRCLDYIWVKGTNYKILKAKLFGNFKATDHKGIKLVLDIN